MDRDRLATRLGELLAEWPEELAAGYLFGSVARGEATASSDVDVAVLYRRTPPATIQGLGLELQDHLTAALGRSVQVVVLDRAPVDLVHRVLRDGILVLERDKSRRIAFEVKARNEYFDLLPILRRYRHPTTASA